MFYKVIKVKKIFTSYTSVFILLFFFFCNDINTFGQKLTTKEYIEKYKDIAIREMNKYKIPASITIAQGLLESEAGNSMLAIKANNHFGIKCHLEWDGPTLYKDDDKKNECFRKYNSPLESFEDHSYFLTSRARYNFLFDLDIIDYKAWAYGLKKAGYATNPKYPHLLIKIIEENKLDKLDTQEPAIASNIPIDTTNILTSENNLAENVKKKIEITNILTDTLTNLDNKREILLKNNIKYTIAKKGDTFLKIAQDFDMLAWQIYKYNDLTKKDCIRQGQTIYLQPKRKKAEVEVHIVKQNETMYYISQLYGVKLKHLYKENVISEDAQPYVGQKIWLRKNKEE